jgi:glycosyltransferase involved in cell wall biosynthesis
MKRLAVIPSDPLEAYNHKSEEYLKDYFNPLQVFKEVFLFSPLEKREYCKAGMKIVPTKIDKFKRRLIDFKIDIVRAYGGYWACDMAVKNKLKNIPVVVSIHDTNPKLLHHSIKKADAVFCTSEVVKKLVLTKFKKSERVWILPNRVDFSIMYPCPEEKFLDLKNNYPFEYRILHVGRKSKQKNLDTLIRALRILGDKYCLLAIGKGDINVYLKLAREQGVEEQCYFIESIPNMELPPYYSMADCMCVPSRWEGFGIVFIEALACGAMVVTSEIAPMNEYICHGENGLLVKDYENPQSLAEMIKLACSDVNLIRKVKENARRSVYGFEKGKIDKLEANYYEKIQDLKSCDIDLWGRIWNFLRLS